MIPTHRPCIRVDHDDVVFTHRDAKRRARVEEITRVHAAGRPVLVGTASVAESEELTALLEGVGHGYHLPWLYAATANTYVGADALIYHVEPSFVALLSRGGEEQR